jgi:Icc-related predicted phosphoesterase
MKRFLLCGGVYGSETALDWLSRLIRERQPDGVLFAGGILHSSRAYEPSETEWGLTREDARFLERFFHTLGELEVFTALIPGPYDTPLMDFLRMGMNAESDYPSLRLADATPIEHHDLAIIGLGGCLVEDGWHGVDHRERTVAEYLLRSLNRSRHARKILLLPAAPVRLGGSHRNRLIDDLIDRHPADLCVVAGPSARRGAQRVGRSWIVNPGCLADGSAAWVDWNRDEDSPIEFVSSHQPAAAAREKQTLPNVAGW